MATLTKDEQIEEWRGRAYRLWDMLDDIDTYADMAKGDRESFFTATLKKVKQRFRTLDSDGHELFVPGTREIPGALSKEEAEAVEKAMATEDGVPASLKERLEKGKHQ